MTTANTGAAAFYELPLPSGRAPGPGAAAARSPLPEPMLLENVRWFCRLRWAAVGMLGTFGILGLFPNVLEAVGLHASADWPLIAAGALAAGNLGFQGLARAAGGSASPRHARLNLWGQIIFDLVILTGVVHSVGSTATNIPFAYLFHIVLACIFLSRIESLAVTLLACALYTACVTAEVSGLMSLHPLYAADAMRERMADAPWVTLWNLGLALGIWLTVWYLACHLSALVRKRDRELAETNRRLEAALEERSKHMLRTTHELKAPFAAIHATTQVLLDGQCGPLPEEAMVFIRRISTRCRRLATEIQEMVQLANLRSESQGAMTMAALDVAEALRWCLAQVQPLAEERRVQFQTDIRPARLVGVEDHLKMLFSNILGNAVAYSHEGGRVFVRSAPAPGGGAQVEIEDQGIGIPPDKLPHIFDEYYRTDEAVRHNKQSSGLGLAIVRHVAETHGIRIRVESRPGAGTAFRVRLPPAPGGPGARLHEREVHDGLSHDR